MVATSGIEVWKATRTSPPLLNCLRLRAIGAGHPGNTGISQLIFSWEHRGSRKARALPKTDLGAMATPDPAAGSRSKTASWLSCQRTPTVGKAGFIGAGAPLKQT